MANLNRTAFITHLDTILNDAVAAGSILPSVHNDIVVRVLNLIDSGDFQSASEVSQAITTALAPYSTTTQVNQAITTAVSGFIAANAIEEFAKTANPNTQISATKIPGTIARVSQLVTVRVGADVPANDLGNSRDGDIYFRFETSQIRVYVRQAGAYAVRFTFTDTTGGGGGTGTNGRNGDISVLLYNVASIGATPPANPAATNPTYIESSGTVNFGSLASGWGNQFPLTTPNFTTQTLWGAWVRVRFNADNSAITIVSQTSPFPLSPVRIGGSGGGLDQDQVDARIRDLVENYAEVGTFDTVRELRQAPDTAYLRNATRIATDVSAGNFVVVGLGSANFGIYMAKESVTGVTNSTDFTDTTNWARLDNVAGTTPPASGDFTFGYRAGTSGDFTELANRMNGTPFDVAFATTGTNTQAVTFRVPDTNRITSIRGGSPGHRGTNEVTAWTESVTGGFATYTRTLVSGLNFSFEIIGGPA